MTKEFRTFIVYSIAALSALALPAAAAEIETIRMTVPFAFTAGTVAFSAGDYVVSQSENHIVTIVGKGGDAILVATPVATPASSASGSATCTLTFERTDKGNMLTGVRMPGSASELAGARPGSIK
jgi:hypothetical protein